MNSTKQLFLGLVGITTVAMAACAAPSGESTTSSSSSLTEPVIHADIDPKIISILTGVPAGGGAPAFTSLADLPADLGELLTPANRTKLKAVMKSFTVALGTDCGGCHKVDPTQPSGFDFLAPTPEKNIADKMWSQIVKKLKHKNGSAIYCDSCHQDQARQGRKEFLDRTDLTALADFMAVNFQDSLVHTNGDANTCSTCHGGEPGTPEFDGKFLLKWAATP